LSIHPIFGQVRVVLVEAASTGLLTGRAASQALATLARGEAWSLADEPAVTDALVRLAWLLFVRAPQLDGRYVDRYMVGQSHMSRKQPPLILFGSA
jgi:hypothetical protein